MSSCLSGGGRAYRIESLDIEIIKSPSWISNSSSPSSTLSESSNGPRSISTRKPRTPRKRPNQTYNEAAAILSTAYPKVFPAKPDAARKFTTSHHHTNTHYEPSSSDLLMPFQIVDHSGFLLDPPLLQRPPGPTSFPELKGFNFNPCQSPGEINSNSNSCREEAEEEDFDAESMLDEEIGEGIDSIMGNLESIENYNSSNTQINNGFCYGYPVGLGFGMMRREMRAIRNGDECDWWRFPIVNVLDITPNLVRIPQEKKNKKKKKVTEIINSISTASDVGDGEESVSVAPQPNAGLLLKLNYDSVLNDWSDKASPIPGDSPASQSAGNDVQARVAQIDLFWENGGIREASVLRYKEKRRSRLFSKKIRYQVRKFNADRRPRMKGRFVRTPNSSDD